jgi:pyruvate kinase
MSHMHNGQSQGFSAEDHAEVVELIGVLGTLRADMLRLEQEAAGRLGEVHPTYQASAANLLHYIALRRQDVRQLQQRLARLGLSSLGRAESHVLANVDAVLRLGHQLLGRPWTLPAPAGPVLDYLTGQRLLDEHTQALLGPPPPGRSVRIMVTMPGEAADDPALVRQLVEAGMDCMRINCAHDDASAWERMIGHLHRAEAKVGRKCRVLMDVGGPKLRTGPVTPGPRVVRWRPRRDELGRVPTTGRWRLPNRPTTAFPCPPRGCAV